MITSFRHTSRWLLYLCLGACAGLVGTLHAQPPVQATAHSLSAMAPPPVPQPRSPVEQFRELLALTPAERENHLTNRPPEIRKRILAKLQEYDAMNANERELRLRNTQLRWYMLSFMAAPAGDRATQLAAVPQADRQFVQDHLAQWDRLPAEEQKEVLKYEQVMENLASQGLDNAASAVKVMAMAPASNRPDTLKNLDSFLQLPPEQRQQMYGNFQKFFELSDAEKQKTLGILPPAERAQMTMALHNFARLPKPQRDQCLRSFAKFSDMSETERQEFLKNAERWRELSPAERAAWRQLVNRVPALPPLPPGIAFPPPLPPMPPRLTFQGNLPPVPTNSSP